MATVVAQESTRSGCMEERIRGHCFESWTAVLSFARDECGTAESSRHGWLRLVLGCDASRARALGGECVYVPGPGRHRVF